MLVLSGGAFLAAQLTHNWTIIPAAILLGAMAAPFALVVWVDDRTRIGRSVAPDVLFITFIVGGGIAVILVGIFTSDFLYHPIGHGWTWIAVTEELAKVLVALVVCSLVPKYRTVESALALALVSAAGFAWMESVSYGFAALDTSVNDVHNVLLERSAVTPFGHLPWTGIAVIVAARAWNKSGRFSLSPRALWGFALVVVLHALWDAALVWRGRWLLFTPALCVISLGVFFLLLRGVRYDGPYAIPAEPAAPRHLTRRPSEQP